MKFWKWAAGEPEGAIPARKAAAVGLALGAAALALYLALGPGGSPAEAPAPAPPAVANENPAATVQAAGAAVADAADRQDAELAAAALVALEEGRQEREDPAMQERELERQRLQAVQDLGWPPAGGTPPAAPGLPPEYLAPGAQQAPGGLQPDVDAEFLLQQRRAMQASLSSPPVAHSVRGSEPPPPPAVPEAPPGPDPGVPPPPDAPAEGPALEAAAPDPGLPALPAAVPRPDFGPHLEVIDEGAIAEAVMLTEIRADFAGPVQAMVNIPMWSRDRQRVLIPRGTKALGTAGPVEGWGQSRLAVGFHRLVLPSGERVELEFRGLSQSGASSLKDRVNRHYLSTFGAAGAVGLVAGLSQLGAQRPSLASAGDPRFVAGQRMGDAAGQIFERYLNRPPSIRIRAGHRVRLYFSSDAVVPRRFPPG